MNHTWFASVEALAMVIVTSLVWPTLQQLVEPPQIEKDSSYSEADDRDLEERLCESLIEFSTNPHWSRIFIFS